MNVKDFLIGAGVALVGVALGVGICHSMCNNEPVQNCEKVKCEKVCEKPQQCDKQQACEKDSCDMLKNCPKQRGCPMEMCKELNLTDDQKDQIKALKESRREAMKVERQKFDEEFQSILTEEQKATLEKFKAEKKQRRCEKKCDKPCDKE